MPSIRSAEPTTLLAEAQEVLPDAVSTPTSRGSTASTSARPAATRPSGVRRLAKRLGIGRRDVIAFGDNLNDHELLRWAGPGVAMANAHPFRRSRLADELTGTNDDDGVAVVIEAMLP